MKAHWVVGIALAAGLCAHAQECAVAVNLRAGVVMQGDMMRVAHRARARAAAMFREIGVTIDWTASTVRPGGADDTCGTPLVIQLENTAGARVSPEALAYATPFVNSGICIHVLMDRLTKERDSELVTALLAHVLAHEITHVLERNNRHSANGVMKAHWDVKDYRRMQSRSLRFADEDVALIHRGIAERMRRVAAE
jgi:hypothetical protein